jgi:hypothetical protein
MSYVLNETIDKSEAVPLVIPYAAGGEPVGPGKKAAGELVFFLRPRWRGRDTKRVNDAMWANDAEGKTIPKFGSGAQEKVVCGVVAIEGLTSPDGREVDRMTREVADALPSWMIDLILGRLNELNAEREVDSGE